MHHAGQNDDARLIADLNDLLQLDHDAVEAYTVAINMARDSTIREKLVDFRADHKRHIEEIASLVRARGGLPLEMPHPTGALKLAVQGLGSIASDDTLLLAFKAVEGQARDKYRRYAKNSYPDDVAKVIQRAAEDEEKHYEWVESTLSARGVGEGTLPHGVARLVEGIHKAIANPVEGLQRQVVEQVGRMVGTTRTRGGSAAPSPVDVASGMAAGPMGGNDAMGDRTNAPGEQMESMGDRVNDMADRAMDRTSDMGEDRSMRGESAQRDSSMDDVVVDSSIVGPGGRPAREELRDELEGRSDADRDNR